VGDVHVHRELLDPALAPYVSGYVQQLRGLHAAGTRWYNKVVVGSDHLANLRIDMDHLRVRVMPRGGPEFEYFYSDHVDGWFYATPGYRYFEVSGPWYVGGIQGGGVRVQFPTGGVPRAKPIYSTNLDPGKPPKWAHKDIFDVGIPFATQSKDFFKTWVSWQMQRVNEKAWYYDNKPDTLLTSTWGTTTGRLSMVGWGDYHWSDINGGIFPPYDILYDLPPTTYDASGAVMGGIGPYLGPNCWWRHGAMQVVGDRKFFIVGDNKGRLHVYPVKAYWSDPKYYNTLVSVGGLGAAASTALEFRTATPVYPDWVTLSPVDDMDVLLWWNWAFNKDATKAATIALHEDPRAGYSFYAGDLYDPSVVASWRAFPSAFFNSDPDHKQMFHTSMQGPAPRVLTPGLVEIAITITITGLDEMDFAVSVDVLRSDFFKHSGRYYQEAAYTYGDSRLTDVENGLGIPEDTLVTTELQCYSDDGTWYLRKVPDPTNPPNFWTFETKEDGTLWWRSDPAMYTEGYDWVGALPNVVWVVRRQDTDADIIRETIAFANSISDMFFPGVGGGDARTPYLPDGWGGNKYISGIWLHNMFIDSELAFFTNGPDSGPFQGGYCYGGIWAVDLRALTYGVFRNHITFTGEPILNTLGQVVGWHPRTQREEYQIDLYAFGEHQDVSAYAVNSAFPNDDFLGYPAEYQSHEVLEPIDPAYFSEPAMGVPLNPAATPVYSSAAISFMNLQTYNELKIHPKGHLSCQFISGFFEVGLDILQFRTKTGENEYTDTKTTHREMFNKAFGQDRPLTYYNGEGCYGFESGSFRLSGFWLPYRSAQ